MGRPAKIDETDVYGAVARLVSDDGPGALTMRGIAASLNVPTGSLYHRYPNRDVLVGHAWLDAVRRFQVGFIEALAHDDLDMAVALAATHTPRWASAHPAETGLLLRHSRESLLAIWPTELGDLLSQVNKPAEAALAAYAKRRWGKATPTRLRLLRFALTTIPSAAVRDHSIDEALTKAIAAAALAAVRL